MRIIKTKNNRIYTGIIINQTRKSNPYSFCLNPAGGITRILFDNQFGYTKAKNALSLMQVDNFSLFKIGSPGFYPIR